MSADRFQRLIMLDSGLRAESGHHANFNRLLLAEADRRGWARQVYANRGLPENLQKELGALRHFVTSPYDLPHVDTVMPQCADLANFLQLNEAYEAELHALELDCSSSDLILIPTITHNQLLGLARWLGSGAAPANAHFAVMLLFAPGWDVLRTGEALAAAMYRYALKLLATVPAKRLTLLAETQPMADTFAALAEREVRVAPWPTVEPNLSHLHAQTITGDALHIGYLGYAKAERGIHLLPEVIARVLQDTEHVRFFVQVDTFQPRTVQAEVQTLQSLGDRVTVHLGSMPREHFLETLSGIDLVMMPYDPLAYRSRGSALFSETAMLGKTMLIPANTWMAQQLALHDLGGVCFETFDTAGITAGLLDAIGEIRRLQGLATAAAPDWLRRRTARAFLNALAPAARPTAQFAVSTS